MYDMQNAIITSALTLAATAAGGPATVKPDAHAHAAKKLFLDVHNLGAGNVSTKDVANAHKKDLATQARYGVDFKAYWVDEKAGRIYCLAEAPSAQETHLVHQHAHGLLASKVMEVTSDNLTWAPTPGTKLFLDVHQLGAGKVTPRRWRPHTQRISRRSPNTT